MDSFLDLTKVQHYEEMKRELETERSRRWTWPRFFQLLEDLGVTDVNGFMTAGWWVPVEVRADPAATDALADKAEAAIKSGRLPHPDTTYEFSHIQTLAEICDLTPDMMVDTLIWVYSLTLGEDRLKESVRRAASGIAGDDDGSNG
ncbi:MAG: hypothetical protein WD535_03850 [Thermaerobacterales bacterium]